MVPACAAKLDGASRADFRTVSTVRVGSKKVVGNQPSDDLTHRDTSCGYGTMGTIVETPGHADFDSFLNHLNLI